MKTFKTTPDHVTLKTRIYDMNDIQRNILATAAGFQPTGAGLYEVRYSCSELPEEGAPKDASPKLCTS